MNDDDTRREREHFIEILRIHDHRRPLNRRAEEPSVHHGGGAYVETPRRILRHEHSRRRIELTAEHEFLLVPTR